MAPPKEKTKQELQLDQERLWKFQRAQSSLDAFARRVDSLTEHWLIAARNIGSAYKLAGNNFLDALKEQEVRDALITQIVFSVLTVAAAGSFSWITGLAAQGAGSALEYATWRLEAAKRAAAKVNAANKINATPWSFAVQTWSERVSRMKHLSAERALIVAAVEDATQAGFGEAFSAVAPTAAPVLAPKPVLAPTTDDSLSKDPQVFQNDKENAVSQVKAAADDYISDIQHKWATAPRDYWDNYDDNVQQQANEKWLSIASNLPGDQDLPDVEWMAWELERGMWAKWLPRLHHIRYQGKSELPYEDDDSVGSAIEKRLDELRILADAGTEIHWYQRANTEAQKLIAWATNYQLRSWATVKQLEQEHIMIWGHK